MTALLAALVGVLPALIPLLHLNPTVQLVAMGAVGGAITAAAHLAPTGTDSVNASIVEQHGLTPPK